MNRSTMIRLNRIYHVEHNHILAVAITERPRLFPGFMVNPTAGNLFYTYILCTLRNEELILDSLGCLDSDLLF